MKTFRRVSAAFIVTVIVSLAVHAVVVFWVVRQPGLDLVGLLAERMLFTTIVDEGPASGRKTGGHARAARPAPERGISVPAEDTAPSAEQSPGAAEGGTGGVGAAVAPPASGAGESHSLASPAPHAERPETAGPQPSAQSVAAAPALISVSRERFYFEIYWLGIYVGKAVLEAASDGDVVQITSEVHSAPVISAFYKVEDHAMSMVRGRSPVSFRIRQREGKYRSDKETIFDTAGGRVTYVDYLKGLREEHALGGQTLWDVISGFFYLRTLPLAAGKTLSIDLFDSNKFIATEVNVLRNDTVRFPGGDDIDAVVVRPILKTDGLFQRKGDILIWLSNDDRRIPLRVETSVSIGTVTAELKRMERER